MRLAKEFGMTPDEVGRRFSAKEIGEILAFEAVQREIEAEQQREAELQAKAAQQRNSL